jgi:hypothetical protein
MYECIYSFMHMYRYISIFIIAIHILNGRIYKCAKCIYLMNIYDCIYIQLNISDIYTYVSTSYIIYVGYFIVMTKEMNCIC